MSVFDPTQDSAPETVPHLIVDWSAILTPDVIEYIKEADASVVNITPDCTCMFVGPPPPGWPKRCSVHDRS